MIEHVYKAKSEVPNALVAIFLGTILLYVVKIGDPLFAQFRSSSTLDELDFNNLGYMDVVYLVSLFSSIYMLGIVLIYIGLVWRRGFDKNHNKRYEFAIFSENSRVYDQYIAESKVSNIFASCSSLSFFSSTLFFLYGITISYKFILVSLLLMAFAYVLINVSVIPFRDFDRLMAMPNSSGAKND